MSSYNPALLAPIVIDATNNKLNYKYPSSGGEKSITLTNSTYYLNTLATHIQAKLVVAGDVDITVAVETTTSPLGRIKFTAGASTLSLLWHTGTNGYHGTDTNCHDELGFNDNNDDSCGAGETITSDYQAPSVWFSTRPPSGGDRYWGYEFVGGKRQRTLSGTNNKQVYIARRRSRQVKFAGLPPEIILNDSAGAFVNQNRDFESFWVSYYPSSLLRYCADQTDLAAYVSCYMTAPNDFAREVKAPLVDCEVYEFTLGLDRQET